MVTRVNTLVVTPSFNFLNAGIKAKNTTVTRDFVSLVCLSYLYFGFISRSKEELHSVYASPSCVRGLHFSLVAVKLVLLEESEI